MRLSLLMYLFVPAAVLVFSECAKDKTPAPPEPCDPNKVYYTNDIAPLISANCSSKEGCHNSVSKPEGLDLSTYHGLMQIVKPGRPNDSEIMEVINSSNPEKIMPQPPNPPFTQAQKDLISKWISEGAYNNYCINDTSSCATGTVSYSQDLTKILSNCQACHSGSVIKGGVDLSNYNGVKVVGLNGKLYNSVAQNGKAIPMPESPNPKLQTCDVKKIKSWVDAGCLNN
jgi:hypothetical protein